MRRLLILSILVLLAVSAGSAAAQTGDDANLAQLQVLNLLVETGDVDVLLDQIIAAPALTYGTQSGLLDVQPGTHSLTLYASGASNSGASVPLLEPMSITFEAGHDYALIMCDHTSDGTVSPLIIDLTAEIAALDLPPDTVPKVLVNAVDDIIQLELIINDEVVAENLHFGAYVIVGLPIGDVTFTLNYTYADTPDQVCTCTRHEVKGPWLEIRGLTPFSCRANGLICFMPTYETLHTIPLADLSGVLSFAAEHQPEAITTLTTFYDALAASGLLDVLDEAENTILLAPVDDAFQQMPADEREALFADPDALRERLAYHIVQADDTALPAMPGDSVTLTTLHGADVTITLPAADDIDPDRIAPDGSAPFNINGQTALYALPATNGTVIFLDRVLQMP